ncbi:uncharacterized protein LOC128270151 [Anopheles cruzii]|uniref:uncharacterized protein LOC128270151 n=1 Tax=Anopheles cruzii TaxID=68878 RepID=UPI0022EC221F|nr:uncharacterized protein LOC128270151 [Anopheles cruzii]
MSSHVNSFTNFIGEMNVKRDFFKQPEEYEKHQPTCGDFEAFAGSEKSRDSMENFCTACGSIYEYSVKNMAKLFQRRMNNTEKASDTPIERSCCCTHFAEDKAVERVADTPPPSAEGSVKRLRSLFEAKTRSFGHPSPDVGTFRSHRITRPQTASTDGTDNRQQLTSPSLVQSAVDPPHPEGQGCMFLEELSYKHESELLHNTTVKNLPGGLQINITLTCDRGRSVSKNSDR